MIAMFYKKNIKQSQRLVSEYRIQVAPDFAPMKLPKTRGNHRASKAGFQLPTPLTRWNPPRPKATIMPLKQEFSCLHRGPNEAHQDQRQPSCLKSKNSVASAVDPMKLARLKGNHHALKARIQLPPPLPRWSSPNSKATIMPQKQEFSCLHRGPNEAHQDQRQPSCLKSKNSVASTIDTMKLTKLKGNHHATKAGIQLPPPSTRWNSPSSKATIVPHKQEFSCLCLWPDEIRKDQRQPSRLKSKNSVASAFDSMKLSKLKGNHHATKAGIQLPLPLTRWNSPRQKATTQLDNPLSSCLW